MVAIDITSVLDLILAVTPIILGMVSDQEAMQVAFSNIRAFVDYPSMAVTIEGTIGVMMLPLPPKSFRKIGKHLKIIFHLRKYEPRQSIDQTMELVVEVRTKGPLSLEDEPAKVGELFLYDSLVLVVGSVDPEKVKQVMEVELEQLNERHALDRAFYEKAAAYFLTFDMIGTLVSPALMLGNMSDVDILAKGMATALITTLYGSLIANIIYLPIASESKIRHDEEFLYKQPVMEGALAAQEGESPKLIEEKLSKPLPAIFVG